MTNKKDINRREALKRIGGLALGSAGLVSPLAAAPKESKPSFPNIITNRPSKKPNILWITAEGVPISLLSSYQHTRWGDLRSGLVDTPNIDRLATEGMLFENAFVTNALCAPSRATLLTGKYSHENGVTANVNANSSCDLIVNNFDTTQPTFPKIMQQNGYQTGIMGKWHLRNGDGGPVNPAKVGFDKFAFKTGAGGPYYNPHGYLQNPRMGSAVIEKKSHQGYITNVFTDMAIQTMQQFDQPFLMMMQYFNDHYPYEPPHKYDDLYEGRYIPEPSTFWDDYRMRSAGLKANQLGIEDMSNFNPPPYLTDRQRKQYNYQKLMKRFLSTLKAMDDNIGRLLDYLDQNNLSENTIVVFTSDHGYFLGEHGLYDKRFMYEESIRVPWMIRYPGMVEPGSTSDLMTVNLDNASTALDLVNLPVPDEMQGKSLKPILQGHFPDGWRKSMYYHYYEERWALPSYGIRTNRYKLIHYYTVNEWELFDLNRDPDEMESLFETEDPFAFGKYKAKTGYEMVVKKLIKKLNRLIQKYKDTTVEPINLNPL